MTREREQDGPKQDGSNMGNKRARATRATRGREQHGQQEGASNTGNKRARATRATRGREQHGQQEGASNTDSKEGASQTGKRQGASNTGNEEGASNMGSKEDASNTGNKRARATRDPSCACNNIFLIVLNPFRWDMSSVVLGALPWRSGHADADIVAILLQMIKKLKVYNIDVLVIASDGDSEYSCLHNAVYSEWNTNHKVKIP